MGTSPQTNGGLLSNGRPWIDEEGSRRIPRGLTWSTYIFINENILHITHKDSTMLPYLPHMERHLKISETLTPDLSSSTQKIPNSINTEFLEISHSLTWSSEGLWPVPRRCLLFGPCILVLQVPISMIWSQHLTDDFHASSVCFVFHMHHFSNKTVILQLHDTYMLWECLYIYIYTRCII